MEKELLLKKRIQDLARHAYNRDIVTFTDFLDLNELHILNNLSLQDAGVTCRLFGGYEMSERQIAAFFPDALSDVSDNYAASWKFPITCIEIVPLSRKFAEPLNHRDYLGALLNLGIERSVLGDILIKEQSAYIFCLQRMESFILENCTRIRHTQVMAQKIVQFDQVIMPEFEAITGTVASIRLDSVIGLAFKTSRSSMIGLIEGGKVFVNGKMITSNGYHLKPRDIISVRGHGKFQFCELLSETKKGRSRVQINRYI